MSSRYPIARATEILDEHDGVPFGPRSYPCVCGGALAAHAGPTNGGACKATGCKRYRSDLAWGLAYDAWDGNERSMGQSLRLADQRMAATRRKANPVLPGQWRIGVSDVDTCPRAIQYRNKPPEGLVLAWEDKREALMGTMIHDGSEQRMALLYPWRLFEHSLDIPGLDRQSRLDWYDPVVHVLGDIKTAGDWRWDKLGDEGPTQETWDKVDVYALAANKAGMPVTTVRLDYIKRCNGHDETFVKDHDEDRANLALDRLSNYATMLDAGIDLPKTGLGPSIDPLCARCPFRNDCWNIEPAMAAGRSPESYTILGPDPEDEAIEWAIREKTTSSEIRLEAQKTEKEKKNLLDGIEAGRYGAFEGYESGGGGAVDYKAYAEALVAEMEKPEEERRAVDQIPVPHQARYSYTKWGRVRKSILDKEAREVRAAERARAKAEKDAAAAALKAEKAAAKAAKAGTS